MSCRPQRQRLSQTLDLLRLVAECCRHADEKTGTRRRSDLLVHDLEIKCQSVSGSTVAFLELCHPVWLRTRLAWKLAVPSLARMKNVWSPANRGANGHGTRVSDGVPSTKDLGVLLRRLAAQSRYVHMLLPHSYCKGSCLRPLLLSVIVLVVCCRRVENCGG